MNEFMKIANDLAEKNLETNEGGPFGACIVKNGQAVATGANRVLKDYDPTAHAEIVAIRNACQKLNTYDLSECTLYTSCYPCPMCLSAIIWSNIKTVYFGNTKEDAASIGFRDNYIYNFIKNLNHNSDENLKMINVDHNYTIKTFQKYIEKKDKSTY